MNLLSFTSLHSDPHPYSKTSLKYAGEKHYLIHFFGYISLESSNPEVGHSIFVRKGCRLSARLYPRYVGSFREIHIAFIILKLHHYL